MMNESIGQIDTIYALSSASGKAGVSVIRVSGPQAWHSLAALTKNQAQPTPRMTKLMSLSHGSGEIDQAMVIGFKAPASFTGEDVIEYHCHGSPAILEEMMTALSQMQGHRMAQHGEYTRRAFENGKLDLTEAEAIADLIDAETKAQKEQALLQMGGALSTLYNDWAKALTKALAYVEAIIDFPDEDVPDTETAKALPAIQALQSEIEAHLNDDRRGERLRNGLQIAIIGAPNAGKSTLVNLLAQRDVAIVSDMAGTTRDVIEAHLNLGGYPVIVADTAGLRPDQISDDGGHDSIESEGIKRALDRAHRADLRLLMFDGTQAEIDRYTLDLIDENSIVLVNKTDLNPKAIETFGAHLDLHINNQAPLYISTQNGDGISEFVENLTARIKSLMAVSRETPNLTRQRHRTNLEECAVFLASAMVQALPELMAQDLRSAVHALGRITGRVDVEDLLDVIFKDFCIGK